MDKFMLTKILKTCIILLFCIIGYVIFRYTFSLLLPILAAILIALMMEPGVQFLAKFVKIPRAMASVITLLLFLLIIIGMVILIITEIYEGIAYLAKFLPEQLQYLGAVIDHFINTAILPLYEQAFQLFNQLDNSDRAFIQDYISNLFQQIGSFIGGVFQQILFAIPQNLSKVPESLTVIFFVLFASFLLSADLPRVKQFLLERIPKNLHRRLKHIFYSIRKSTFGYFKAQLILITISFHLIFIGLFFIRVEHALTIALLMVVIDLIPFIGTGLLFIPWMLYSFLSGDYPLTIGLAIIYGIVIITRQLLEPKVFSMNLAVHPLVWLTAAFIGMKIWGVLGLILAPFSIVLFKGLQDAGLFSWVKDYINGNT